MKHKSELDLEIMYAHGGYWGAHPKYSPDDWQFEVANGDTRSGYWEWVESKLEMEGEMEDEEVEVFDNPLGLFAGVGDDKS